MATRTRPAAPRKPRQHIERDYQEAVADALRVHGALVSRNNVGVATWRNGARTRYGLGLGSGDLVVCARGRYIEIECKANGAQSEAQVCRARAVEQAGGTYLLVRAGVDSVEDVVRRVMVGT
jgi:hypothetical protein